MRWADIYALLATACGYSYPVIDEMTLFDAEELISYWTDHPPVHLLLAAFMGVGNDTPQRMVGRGNLHQPSLSEIMSLPGVGRTVRPFSAQFGPGAVTDMTEMLKRFDASKNYNHRDG